MGLASQSARSGGRRAYMSSRRRRRRGMWMWLILILAAVMIGWWWMSGSDAPDEPTLTVVSEPPTVAPEIGFETSADRTPPTASSRSRDTPRQARPPAAKPRNEGDATTSQDDPGTTNPSPAAADPARPSAPSSTTRPAPTRSPAAVTALEKAASLASTSPIQARETLSQAWLAGLTDIHRANAIQLSRRLADSTLLESPGRGETPYARPHRVLSGEVLSKIIRQEKVEVNAEFLARINGLRNPDSVRQGKDLWLPNGRFHAVVDLSSRDLAVFQEMDDRRDLLIVMSVGIGVDGLTPTGLFRVDSKSSNPQWTDPGTGRFWKADDPQNPIGEHWIGLKALDEADRGNPAYRSLGLHGTTQPETVGTACTNGSLRLSAEDVRLLYEILGSGTSTVEIRE
jgi:hypothetical protein